MSDELQEFVQRGRQAQASADAILREHRTATRYEVTRAYLAKVEEYLGLAADHARKEWAPGDHGVVIGILNLKVKTRVLRFDLEHGKR